MNERKQRFALLGGLFGAVYLAANHLLPSLPDMLMGAVLGLGLVFLVLSLLPEETLRRLRKWKRRGE